MTHDEAKFILQACRTDGSDAADPAVAEALELVRRDPALAQWWEAQRTFDRAFAGRLRQVQPPAGLRESILTGMRADQTARPATRRWRAPQWIGLAASVALLLVAAGFWTTRASAKGDMTEFAADYVTRGFFLAQHGSELEDLRVWLAAQKAPLPTMLPEGFHRLRSLGCKRLVYRGKEVSLICFGESKEYHLFVFRRADFPERPHLAQPQFFKRKGMTGAAWSDDHNHYVAVTEDSLGALKDCLKLRPLP